MQITPFLTMIRIANALMSSGAVVLGIWISRAELSWYHQLLLAFTAFCSTAYGNVVNDIADVETDRISHPERPLPRGIISKREAGIFAGISAVTALSCAFAVAPVYGLATLIPLMLLSLYARYFKATPLAGNVLVSLLVAYSLLFGSLAAPDRKKLLVPVVLAVLLNFCREIIKDLQDAEGDRAAGLFTSASLPENALKGIIYGCSIVYLSLLFVPVKSEYCGAGYLFTVLLAVVPLHTVRVFYFVNTEWELRLPLISKLLKFEMLAGLLALTIDRVVG